MSLDKIQDIASSSIDFGKRILLSADNSTLVVFSEMTETTATVHIHKFNIVTNNFHLINTEFIRNDGGLNGNAIIAHDGSYFITASLLQRNATASLFKINTTNKNNSVVYKVCNFSVSSETESAAYKVCAPVASDYLILSSASAFEIFVWDIDDKNYRPISKFNLTAAAAAITDDGATAIVYNFDDGNDDISIFVYTATNYNGKNSTVASYNQTNNNKFNISSSLSRPDLKYSKMLRNSAGLVIATKADYAISYINNAFSQTADKQKGVSWSGSTFSTNFNGGLISTKTGDAIVFRLDENKFPSVLELNAVHRIAVESNYTVYNYGISASDQGWLAVPLLNKNTNENVVRIYKDSAYPNFYIPSSYHAMTDKDLAVAPSIETADANKFIVTYTYKT